MSLKVLKNTPRKRASTGAIKEAEGSRKRACETTETIYDEIALEAEICRQKAERKAQENKLFVEKLPRQRVRLLPGDQECCGCRDKTRFRTNGICHRCGHRRCAECLVG